MAKTITLRIDEELLDKFKKHAEIENRTISNFIETAAIFYLNQIEQTDEFETNEIFNNQKLLEKLSKAHDDVKNKRGRVVKI